MYCRPLLPTACGGLIIQIKFLNVTQQQLKRLSEIQCKFKLSLFINFNIAVLILKRAFKYCSNVAVTIIKTSNILSRFVLDIIILQIQVEELIFVIVASSGDTFHNQTSIALWNKTMMTLCHPQWMN